MANTMKALQTYTVGAGGAATISFTSIPQTYTDLVIKGSLRNNRGTATSYPVLTFNGSGSGYSMRELYGTGSVAGSTSQSILQFYGDGSGATANTFGNFEAYIPNYISSNNKSLSLDAVNENNAIAAGAQLLAGLWSNTAAITSITIAPGDGATSIDQYSTFTLYGVFNQDVSAAPAAPTIGTATTGTNQASITFTGVSGAASYTMTSSPGSITATGTTSPITVTGLTAGTAYTFTCKANNPLGSSAASAASNSVTPTAAYFLQTWESEPKITYSTDGINWTAVTVDSATGGQNAIKFGSTYAVGRFGTSQPVATSTNLSSWTPRTVGGTSYAYLYKMATDGSIFVAAGGAGGYNSSPVLKTTTDFSTWTDRTPALTYNVYNLSYNNGYFLVADGNGNYAYSTNGTSWTLASAQWSSGGVPNVGLYFNGRWLYAGNGGEIRYSTTINPGANWTAATGQNAIQIQGGWQNGTTILFCHNDGNVSRSTNGTTYTYSATGYSSGPFLSVTYGAGLWVLAARNGVIYTSPDTTTWTSRTSAVTSTAGGSFGGYYG